MLDSFTKAFFSFQLLLKQQCWRFIFKYLFFFISAKLTRWQRRAQTVTDIRRLLSTSVCFWGPQPSVKGFWGGEQWQLWGLQTDLTASFVGTFHRRFSYKCAQRDLSQRLKFPHIIALTLAQLLLCLRISFASSTSTEPKPGMEQAKQNRRYD